MERAQWRKTRGRSQNRMPKKNIVIISLPLTVNSVRKQPHIGWKIQCTNAAFVFPVSLLITCQFIACFLSFLQSRFQGKITKLAKTEKTARLYAADQMGYIYVHDIKKFAPSQRSEKGMLVCFCRSVVLKWISLAERNVFVWSVWWFFFNIESAENVWRAHTSRVTGYVTYTSH